jgi:TolB-like protein/Flp pilus assembly protein TadD
MDIGDAGHILLSRRVADDLAPYKQWQENLHDLGEVRVKHDVRLGIVNLYTGEVGNAACPQKILRERREAKLSHRPAIWLLGTLGVLLLALATYIFLRPVSKLSEKSVALLPFQNLSADEANSYFVQGIEDEILTNLAKISDLKVISRTSTQQYKSVPEKVSTIANQLGVAYILEGTVQKSGETARINVQLIHARTDSHVWAETYDRKLIDILAVETEVAKRIAEQLRARLTGREEKALDLKVTDNTAAYDAYLRGLSYEGHLGFSNDALQAKIKAYGNAVELDPQFAQAWARLASAHAWFYFSFEHTPQRLATARDALEHAQRIAPEAGEVLMALGNIRYVQQDFEGALAAYQQTADALRNSAEVNLRIGGVLRRLGRWDEALTYHTRATQLDPRNIETWKHQGLTLRGLRRYDEAIVAFDHALQVTPGDADLITDQATTYQMQGDLAAAGKVLEALPPKADQGQPTPRRLNQWLDGRQFAPAIAALQAVLAKRAEFSKPEQAETLFNLGYSEILNNQREPGIAHLTEARDLMEQVRSAGGENPFDVLAFGGEIFSLLGDHATAKREIERASAALVKDAFLYPQALTALARAQAHAGENDQAIATLTRVLHMNCAFGSTPGLLRIEPVWDSLRQDPRFQKLTEETH